MATGCSFQHTYEGLKPPQLWAVFADSKGFQHTYEGLKPENIAKINEFVDSFQHTYEGLKHEEFLYVRCIGKEFSAYL